MFKKGFTLAEVLITLAIIGVVAAISIPSVVANTQQKEFQTGLRKAVSVLNSAITMNMAIDGESPYENKDLFRYLMRHMSIMETDFYLYEKYHVSMPGYASNGVSNSAFYTTDGMRFEFRLFDSPERHRLYESQVPICVGSTVFDSHAGASCGGCGSYGLNNNTDKTTKPPCLVTVDVNGDRKPSPSNAACQNSTCAAKNFYKYSDPDGLKLSDVFTIMITDKQAIPYGVAAQRAMYQAQKVK